MFHSSILQEALQMLKLGILEQYSSLEPQEDELFYSDDESSAGIPTKAEEYDIFTEYVYIYVLCF